MTLNTFQIFPPEGDRSEEEEESFFFRLRRLRPGLRRLRPRLRLGLTHSERVRGRPVASYSLATERQQPAVSYCLAAERQQPAVSPLANQHSAFGSFPRYSDVNIYGNAAPDRRSDTGFGTSMVDYLIPVIFSWTTVRSLKPSNE